MREDLPQSVHRCLDELQTHLEAVANSRSEETRRQVGELHSRFHFGRFEDLRAEGLPTFFDSFQAKLRDLGARIANDFLIPAS